jgi:uncharacterized protein with HEPN domain
MNGHPLRSRDYLIHMLDAARQILLYTAGKAYTDFESDRLLQDGVVRNIEILGEAARRLLEVNPDAETRFAGIPFAAIYAMRNQLSHGYFTVDLEIVWKVVERDVPTLCGRLERAIEIFDTNPNPHP